MSKTSFAPADRRQGGLLGGLLVFLVIASALGWIGYNYLYLNGNSSKSAELITEVVSRGAFDHVVLEQGEIESSSNTEVICEVKSRGYSGVPILWVIDEGATVKKGERLVELDAAAIETELRDSKIQVTTAKANVTSAEALVEQAKIARQEYLEGVFKTEESTLLSEIALANQDLYKAQLALESNERLVAKGLVNDLQLEADRFAVENAQNMVDSAKARLKVLRELTKKKMLVQFDSDIESAQAKLSAFQAELLEEEEELADVELQLKKCIIEAPSDGIVVHANKFSSRGGNAEFVVEAGATVRERQAIIRLPDPTKMQVKCRINESRITLVQQGMPVRISVDAIPGLVLKGRVIRVNRYAEPSSFFSSSIKEYAAFIEILNPPNEIRTGMTAEVQIFVEQLSDAVQIPIQGLYEHGTKMYSLVQTGADSFETREVRIGATNDTMATIEEGLSDGEDVVLNLREHLNLMDLPEVTQTDNSDMKELNTVGQNPAGQGGPPAEFGGGRQGGPPGGGRKGGGRPDGGGQGRRGGGAAGQGGGAGGPGGGAGGPGGGAGGPGGGGGPPDPATIVQMTMQRFDTDSDGKLSAAEVGAINAERRGMVQAADGNGDGEITRAELTDSIKKRMSSGGPPR